MALKSDCVSTCFKISTYKCICVYDSNAHQSDADRDCVELEALLVFKHHYVMSRHQDNLVVNKLSVYVRTVHIASPCILGFT